MAGNQLVEGGGGSTDVHPYKIKVLVDSIPGDVSEEDVTNLLKEFKVNIVTMHSKGNTKQCSFVIFDTNGGASNDIQKLKEIVLQLNGKKMQVSFFMEMMGESEKIDQVLKLLPQGEEGMEVQIRSENGKRKNFRWEVGDIMDVEYAFVKFKSKQSALRVHQKLKENLKGKKILVSLHMDTQILFIGNVLLVDLKEAVEEASLEILKVHRFMDSAKAFVAKKPESSKSKVYVAVDIFSDRDASDKIQKVIQEYKNKIIVVKNDKWKNFRWQFGDVENVEYAFVIFHAKNFAEEVNEKLNKIIKQEENINVSLSNDGKMLFIGNVLWDDLKVAVENAAPEIFRVRRKMMEIMGQSATVAYNIEDSYSKFIEELRKKVAKRKKDGGIQNFIDGQPSMMLPKLGEDMDERDLWLDIHLSVKEPNESTTLAIRKDTLYVIGFTGKGGKWFQLGGSDPLPREYKATPLLNWEVAYSRMMKLNDVDQVKQTLRTTRLGRTFVERAVRRLSRYDPDDVEHDDDNPTRLGLAGLIVLINESARMQHIFDAFVDKWDEKSCFDDMEVFKNIWFYWGSTSAALIKWKNSGYAEEKWEGEGSTSDALERVRLVANSNEIDGSSRAWVEILAISANFGVHSITVRNEEGEHRLIYNQEQEPMGVKKKKKKGMRNLKLELPHEVISGYKWLSIDVKHAVQDSAGTGGTITRKLDCRKQKGGASELVARTVNIEPNHKIRVDYQVMSNAVEATVVIRIMPRRDSKKDEDCRDEKIRTDSKHDKWNWSYIKNSGDWPHMQNDPIASEEDDPKGNAEPDMAGDKGTEGSGYKAQDPGEYYARGKITAYIEGSEGSGYQIVLFNDMSKDGVRVNPESLILNLMRSVVPVWPHGRGVNIDLKELVVEEVSTTGIRRVVEKTSGFTFKFGDFSPSPDVNNGSEVQVQAVRWNPPPEKVAEMGSVGGRSWLIEDKDKFSELIKELETKKNRTAYSWLDLRPRPPWIRVKLQVEADGKPLSTSLAISGHKFYAVGFMNQSGVWYDLGRKLRAQGVFEKILPENYNSVLLGWGLSYLGILQAKSWGQVAKKLNEEKLDKEFVIKAVRTLSCYPDLDMKDGHMNPRLALVGLIVMICESARLNPLRDHFLDGWDTETIFPRFPSYLMRYLAEWHAMPPSSLFRTGFQKLVRLTQGRNDQQIHMDDLTIGRDGDKDEYIKLIEKLRTELAHHAKYEDLVTDDLRSSILKRHPKMEWIRIKLQVGEEATTLAVRADSVCLVGFMNQKEEWYWIFESYGNEFGGESIEHLDYIGMLEVERQCEVVNQLDTARLGRDFMVKAVRTLSRFSREDTDHRRTWTRTTGGLGFSAMSGYPVSDPEDIDHRLALAGLSVMVCECAKINPLNDTVVRGWDNGTGFHPLLVGYMCSWAYISEALRLEDHGNDAWSDDCEKKWAVEFLGLRSPREAHKVIRLVLDSDSDSDTTPE